MIIGSFSITSNITGIVSDDIAITSLLHQYGALSVWDYATGASYLDIYMNPSPYAAKDAIFISGHKLLGGVGTPGVLIVKKHLFSQLNPPSRSGGGTVFYVTDLHHRFLSNRIERYEGGTPNITGIWKLGLVFKLKYSLKQKLLQQQQTSQQQPSSLQSLDIQRAYQIQQRLKQIPNLILLDGHYEYNDGSQQQQQKKVPIYSFLIKCGTRFLHYNFVSALLNDLFGIQSRGGCQCAGPYVQHLLGMNYINTNSTMEEQLIKTKDELLRPGITRLSIPTIGTTNEQEEYIINSIKWVAHHGWKFLHVYRCNHRSGEWSHKSRPGNTTPLGINERLWLSHYQLFVDESKTHREQEQQVPLAEAKQNANAVLRLVLQDQANIAQTMKMVEEEEPLSSLRWYVYPKDVVRYIRDGFDVVPGTMDMDNLQGALRPLAMLDDADDKVSQVNPNLYPVVACPPPVDANEISNKAFRFRDGEDHIGEAPLQEIADGFDDGELSDECIIFDDAVDEWKPIEPFLKEAGMISRLSLSKSSLSPPPVSDTKEEEKRVGIVQLRFRDGEHSGEASLEDIVSGFDDGELSDSCQIFNEVIDEWQIITIFLRKENGNKPPSTEEGDARAIASEVDEKVVSKATPAPKPFAVDPDIDDDIAFLNKNDQKRPQRDSSMWGKGQAQPIEPKITTYMKQDDGDEKEEKDDVDVKSKPKRFMHVKPPPKLMKLVTNALIQWDMIEDGDRLLLGLSGGKDSLSLLHVLLEFQRKLPISFDIEVCTIDPMTPSFGKYLKIKRVQFIAIVSGKVLTIFALPPFRSIVFDTLCRVFRFEISLHSRRYW
jgi:selenocysteine lyase/cysteine desulfurase